MAELDTNKEKLAFEFLLRLGWQDLFLHSVSDFRRILKMNHWRPRSYSELSLVRSNAFVI